MSSQKIKVALVEDQAINRQTFLHKLSMISNCELMFISPNGQDFLEQLRKTPESRKPDVVFMDIQMPGISGIETIAIAKKLHPSVRFLVLSVFDDDEKVFEAIKAGAEGYLLKHEPAEALAEAIENVMTFGGAPMSPSIARKALRLLQRAHLEEKHPAGNPLPEQISERETDVLKLMIAGLDAKSIATQMNLSIHTARKHIANIYEKLHVCSRAQVLNLAHQSGWFR